jgi:preprotein translocase subunit YajC
MYLFASGGAGPTAGSPSILGALFPFVLIFVIFYFIIIMPAKKKQKQHQSLITSLKGGERVVTSGGIYGTVARVLEDRFEIQVDNNTKIQVAKSAVSTVIDPTGTEKEVPKK